MKHLAIVAVGVLALATLSSEAQARPGTLTLNLRADVAPFCRIQQSDPDAPLHFEGDRALIGTVTEICNTRSGYTVQAEFLNLTGGMLLAGDQAAEVGADGAATLNSNEARLQQRLWLLTDARRTSASEPVFVRLSISPF